MLQASNKLLKLARQAINSKFTDDKINLEEYSEFSEKKGAFVTLTINSELRGCIGYIEALYPLNETVVKAAISAAFHDSRFNPLSESELDNVKIEISILSKPTLVEKNYLKNINVGKDGLIVESAYGKGLLLPQVAVEQGWEAHEFLEQTCLKAGLEKDSWKDEKVKLYKFQVELISE